MSEYFDIRCGDDLDPFGRDAAPLEVLAQDLYHLLITTLMALLQDPEWGFGLEQYLGRPLPSTLATDVETAVRADDRVNDATCKITKLDTEEETYRLDLTVEAEAGFVEIALKLTPSGIVRVA